MSEPKYVPRPDKHRGKFAEWYPRLEATLTNGKGIEMPLGVAIRLQQVVRTKRDGSWNVHYRQTQDQMCIAWAEKR